MSNIGIQLATSYVMNRLSFQIAVFFVVTLLTTAAFAGPNGGTCDDGSEKTESLCVLNSGHIDQDEKVIVCYTRDTLSGEIYETWSVSNEIPINFMAGDPDGDLFYGKDNTLVNATGGFEKFYIPELVDKQIVGGVVATADSSRVGLLVKDANGFGKYYLYSSPEDGDMIFHAESPNKIHAPVWILGSEVSASNPKLYVASRANGIYTITTEHKFENLISRTGIASLIGTDEFEISGGLVSSESTTLHEIAFAVNHSDKSEILRFTYDIHTGSAKIEQAITDLPFEVGGLLADNGFLFFTARNESKIYSVTTTTVTPSHFPITWKDYITLEASESHAITVERPTQIMFKEICEAHNVLPQCVYSECNDAQTECEYFANEVYLSYGYCENGCGQGTTICTVDDADVVNIQECSLPEEEDLDANGVLDCLEDPIELQSFETEPEEDTPTPAVTEADEPTAAEIELPDNNPFGTVSVNGDSIIGCSLILGKTQTSSFGMIGLAVLGFAALLGYRLRQLRQS